MQNIYVHSYKILACILAGTLLLAAEKATKAGVTNPPNIIFIVLDDTGIDQWANFGWTQDLVQRAPVTPVLDAITDAGIKFTPGSGTGAAAKYWTSHPNKSLKKIK